MPAPTQLSSLRTFRPSKRFKISAVALTAAGCTTALALAGTATQSTSALPAINVAKVSADGQAGTKVQALTKGAAVSSYPAYVGKPAAAKDASRDLTKGPAKAKPVAAAQHKAKPAANRSTVRKPVAVSAPKYSNNLDGWIRESLAIMKSKGIPGSYSGLHRNIMRESSGNPNAVNDWDINAINGIPSKGLLQVIQPTFDTYHVAGTANRLTDPVANITAAANYAAHRYGSIDNVNSAY
ncbi:transglycosylase SLT domain-containing protein [Streptomyces sp. SID13666]|uniref:transglycosylase SLT domain-containing protein n=1 Tax=Streptomyces TaxID=1883 RepID=UPI0011073C6E|nr:MULTISPECIES: transglycosylase SLT domain-containing protein [Streptomyces]MCZ4095416.1 transglycosylase SLT domain-containing protein [Streptomyces sp. H39-C1]NEA52945.1 transglycosylase SLT domain-containing protein [Streptomyces sp. SID13666]NEA69728.1 transglycosylase SLT domain-containing protein [Streptomyces sp. SID13588]QNA71128.1 transglycosylase SLT domain-containing protein [Streptomyces sp. So13.3]